MHLLDYQRDAPEGPQDQCSGRVGRGPLWMARAQSLDGVAGLLHLPSHDEFQPRQHPQSHGQQVKQAGDASIRVHRKRGQRQGFPFKPPKPVCNPVLLAIRQHDGWQRQGRMVGGIDTPSQALCGRRDGCLQDICPLRSRV